MNKIVATGMNPVKLMAQTKTMVSLVRVPDKGVTKFFFEPPMKFSVFHASTIGIHKAEIVAPKDSEYIMFNFYNLANEVFSCIISKDGKVSAKEFPPNCWYSNNEEFKRMMNSIIYVINQQVRGSLSEREKQVIAKLRPVIDNEALSTVNTTGKEKTIRVVRIPEDSNYPQFKEVRYTIISPEGKGKTVIIKIHNDGITFVINNNDKNKTNYTAKLNNGGNVTARLMREPYATEDNFMHDLNDDDKSQLEAIFNSILKEEHNQEYINIINKVQKIMRKVK